MPELPEVQTIVSDLQKILPELKIMGVETDWKKMFKNCSFENFKKEVFGEKILDVRRLGKNILIDLSGGKTIIIHQKMTGHFLYGNWELVTPPPSGGGKRGGEGKGGGKGDPPKPPFFPFLPANRSWNFLKSKSSAVGSGPKLLISFSSLNLSVGHSKTLANFRRSLKASCFPLDKSKTR